MKYHITAIGSCRLNEMANLGVNLLTDITLCHSTKDILQLIKWIKGILIIPEETTKHCFHKGISSEKTIPLTNELKENFNKTDIFLIEISSYHSLMYQGIYFYTDIKADPNLHPQIRNIPEDIRKNARTITDNAATLEQDIDEILKLIDSKRLIIVTHILDPTKSEIIPRRRDLIDRLAIICNRKKLEIIKPGEILINNDFKDILLNDYQHYTPEGLLKLRQFYLQQFIRLDIN